MTALAFGSGAHSIARSSVNTSQSATQIGHDPTGCGQTLVWFLAPAVVVDTSTVYVGMFDRVVPKPHYGE